MTEYFLKTRLKVAYLYQAESRKKKRDYFPLLMALLIWIAIMVIII